MLWPALKMLLVLGTLFVFLFFLVRLLRRMELGRRPLSPDAGIQILTKKMIAPQKYISLVEIGGEILALGISSEQITFLTKMEDKETVKRTLAQISDKAEPFWVVRNRSGWFKRIKMGPMGMAHEK